VSVAQNCLCSDATPRDLKTRLVNILTSVHVEESDHMTRFSRLTLYGYGYFCVWLIDNISSKIVPTGKGVRSNLRS